MVARGRGVVGCDVGIGRSMHGSFGYNVRYEPLRNRRGRTKPRIRRSLEKLGLEEVLSDRVTDMIPLWGAREAVTGRGDMYVILPSIKYHIIAASA